MYLELALSYRPGSLSTISGSHIKVKEKKLIPQSCPVTHTGIHIIPIPHNINKSFNR